MKKLIGDAIFCRNKSDLEYLKIYTKEFKTDWKHFDPKDHYPIVVYFDFENHVCWSDLNYFYKRQINNYDGGYYTKLIDINLILRKEKLKKLSEQN